MASFLPEAPAEAPLLPSPSNLPAPLPRWMGPRGSLPAALEVQTFLSQMGTSTFCLFSEGQSSSDPVRATPGWGLPCSFKSDPAYLYLPQTVMGNPGTQEMAGWEVAAEATGELARSLQGKGPDSIVRPVPLPSSALPDRRQRADTGRKTRPISGNGE